MHIYACTIYYYTQDHFQHPEYAMHIWYPCASVCMQYRFFAHVSHCRGCFIFISCVCMWKEHAKEKFIHAGFLITSIGCVCGAVRLARKPCVVGRCLAYMYILLSLLLWVLSRYDDDCISIQVHKHNPISFGSANLKWGGLEKVGHLEKNTHVCIAATYTHTHKIRNEPNKRKCRTKSSTNGNDGNNNTLQ